MKPILLSVFAMIIASSSLHAQSEKYTAAMKKNIAAIDSGIVKGNMQDLANNFERIATAEKTQWLPYYYASYCTVMTSLLSQDKSKSDGIADKAESFITQAETLAGGENSETCVIKSMIASAHMMVDPQSRWQQYGASSSENIAKAEKLDPTNPRPVLLDGQSKFYTPEQFGGGKTVAKPILQKSMDMYPAFKPASELAPTWGKQTTQYFLSQCN